MKFGKRLAAEAARRWPEHYVDYKAIKKALKDDIRRGDAEGSGALRAILAEAAKVSAFYTATADALEARLDALDPQSPPAGGAASSAATALAPALPPADSFELVRADTAALIKFVALNYLAVVKVIKKRNRHFKSHFGDGGFAALHPLDLLSGEVFFTSDRLARLATRAEVLSRESDRDRDDDGGSSGSGGCGGSGGRGCHAVGHACSTSSGTAGAAGAAGAAGGGGASSAAAAAREALCAEYTCPVCLDLLRSPVVLTCAHRFCWGCLVAHFAAIRGPRTAARRPYHHQQQQQQQQPSGSADGAATAMDVDAGTEQQHHHHHHHHHHHQQQHQAQQPKADSTSAAAGPSANLGAADGGAGSARSSSDGSAESLVVLEKIVEAADAEETGYYACPLCRQPQVLNIESLQVDQHLARYVDDLRAGSAIATAAAAVEVAVEEEEDDDMAVEIDPSPAASGAALGPVPAGGWLLPPQRPEHAGRLTVLLDLDGTLISSFTPKRAPRLPASMATHVVGVGSSLNPGGVFVVERPGLREFLRELAGFAEVVVFTAGLKEYAEPIVDAIDPDRTAVAARLYRDATARTEWYQCVKDMARAGRPLGRTVLVDDTPLAFLRQPANGVPVLGFRGDPDDRLLGEAVLPLLQTLAGAPDVRPLLERRFGMPAWFAQHGYPRSIWEAPAPAAADASAAAKAPRVSGGAGDAASSAARRKLQLDTSGGGGGGAAASAVAAPTIRDNTRPLLLLDFDKTLTDWDAAERLVGELAPELAPQLAAHQMPADFVPLTNDVLAELQRRGVGRDALLVALQRMGSEVPEGSARMLKDAKARGAEVCVLSDCNLVFIRHILAGARLQGCVDDVVTNGAAFERVVTAADDNTFGLGCGGGGSGAGGSGGAPSSAPPLRRSASHKLVIAPRRAEPAGCPLCPSNLCKGDEVRALLAGRPDGSRIVYAGDGANDICPAAALRASDVVLARAGHALAAHASAAALGRAAPAIRARVLVWHNHTELAALAAAHLPAAAAGEAAAACAPAAAATPTSAAAEGVAALCV